MSFDPDQFLAMTLDGTNSTKVPQLQNGEYVAVLGKPEAKEFQGKKDPTKSYLSIRIPATVEVPADQQADLGRDKATVSYDLFIDRTPSGGIDMGEGRNIGLGRLREACDLNKPGQPFSFAMFEGKAVRVKVEREVTGSGDIYAKVKQVAKL